MDHYPPRLRSRGAAGRAVYTDTTSETWSAVPGLALFGCLIWWITTGTGYWAQLARSSRAPPGRRGKAICWIAYAATAPWVLANSSCEGPGEPGRQQERQPRQDAAPIEAGGGREN